MAKFKKKTIKLNGNIYVAEKIIGKGQFGVIYLARSKQKTIRGKKIPKYVAIKEYFVSRFYDPVTKVNKCDYYWKREVKNTKLQGEYSGTLLTMLDAGIMIYENRKEFYIVLTFLEGIPFQAWFSAYLTQHPIISEEDISYFSRFLLVPIAKHLEYCHQKQLIHRDLSVENIFITTANKKQVEPVILDWGASVLLQTPAHLNPSKSYTAFMNKGTPPEIVTGKKPSAASDVYMFGHLMYFLFSGGKTARTPAIHEDYVLKPQLDNPQIPTDYDLLVQKCTQYEVTDRITDMGMVIHVLEKLELSIPSSEITHLGKAASSVKSGRSKHSPSQSKATPVKNPFLSSSPTVSSDSRTPPPIELPQVYSIPGPRPKPIPVPTVAIEPELKYIRKFNFQTNPKMLQYAKAFLTYFENPRWMYLRQDTFQIYHEFLVEVGHSLKTKDIFLRYETISTNVYFVGQLLGSIIDLQAIIAYFRSVLKVAPKTKIIFLGNFLNFNSHDVEAFTMLLSFYCLFSQNVILLRGQSEEEQEMATKGFMKHLKLKFGAYQPQIGQLFLNIVQSLDLLCITELTPQLKCLATSGGIPFDFNTKDEVILLKSHLPELVANQTFRKEMTTLVQSILWGVPNELADELGSTSKGIYQFSWSYLTEFFSQNQINYLFRSAHEPRECRVIWKNIHSLNSCSYSRNKPKWEAKIMRVNQKGLSSLNIKDLPAYFQRDYSHLH